MVKRISAIKTES